MAGRSGPTFQKRQKEKARQEKQRDKVERRSVRKQDKASGIPSSNNEIDYNFNPYEGLEEMVFDTEEEAATPEAATPQPSAPTGGN